MKNFHLNLNVFKHQETAHRGTTSHSHTHGTERRLVMQMGHGPVATQTDTEKEEEQISPWKVTAAIVWICLLSFLTRLKLGSVFPTLAKKSV